MPLNIAILGLGQLGSSLGLALGTLDQEALPSGRPVISGWDADKRTLQDARGRLMIDRVGRDAVDAVRDADIVFVDLPTTKLAETFSNIAAHLKQGAVVSDVTSSKALVLRLAQEHLPTTVDFIGGHPIIAAHRNTAEPSIDLFKSAIYCLIPSDRARPNAVDVLAELVTAIGAKPYYIEAAEHDAYVAGVQHLPLVVSAALMEAVSRSGGWREMQPIAGVPFQTATQLPAEDVDVLAALCASNSVALGRWLDDFIRLLVEFRDDLENREALTGHFSQAKDMHERWLAAQPNMRPGEADYYGQPEQVDRSLTSLLFGQRRKKDRRSR